MEDKLSITLEGKLATEYITLSTQIKNLTESLEAADSYIKALEAKLAMGKAFDTPEPVDTTSSRVLRDAEMLKDLEKKPVTKVSIFKANKSEPSRAEVVVKYKTRLSKQDKKDFDIIAKGKFRGKSMIKEFAAARNLRPSTVMTYINKHSNNKYVVVSGKDIPKVRIWDNAIIQPSELYFTSRF